MEPSANRPIFPENLPLGRNPFVGLRYGRSGLVELRHVGTQVSGPVAHMTAISDLVALDTDQGLRVYSASGPQGGVLVWDPAQGLAQLDISYFETGGGLDAPRQLTPVDFDGAGALLVAGAYGTGVEGYWLASDGRLDASFTLAMTGGVQTPEALLTLQAVTAGGRSFFLSSSRQSPGLEVWERSGSNQLTAVAQSAAADAFAANDVFAIAPVTLGGQIHVLALSAAENSLVNFTLSGDGMLTQVARLDMRDGLAVGTPTQLQLVQVGGQDYALVGAAGTGSVSVVALAPGGGMQVTDQVNDDLGTRFAGLSVLEAVTVGGQVYVVAGGADDGLTLMTLLPGGRLVHLGTLADDAQMALTDPGALALAASGNGIDIFAAGEVPVEQSEAGGGLTQLRADLGAIGQSIQLPDGGVAHAGTNGRDQIAGGAGNDALSGGAGNDILMDGAGEDTLRGGGGADVFVLSSDSRTDWIRDFEPGTDRLDLSDWGRFYTVDALQITPTATGAEISLGEELLRLDTAGGQPLEAGDFAIGDLRDLWHVAVASLPEADMVLQGGASADLLQGGGGDDTLIGGGGADILQGKAGDDWLFAEIRDAGFDTVSARVFRLYQAALDRVPDLHGLFYWTDILQTGARSLTSVSAGFVDSPEFQNTYGETDDSAFVTLLYSNVLDRAPDAVGLSYWIDLLGSGARSRPEVVIGFSESREFIAKTAAEVSLYSRSGLQAGFADDVYRLYQATLGRNPDKAGFLDWTARLAAATLYETVVSGFADSAEFRATYGATTDEEFVTLLYANVLGRSPDPAGLQTWLDRLDGGGFSREQVVEGFAQSREFILSSATPMAAWLRAQGSDDVLDGGTGANMLQGGILSDSFVFVAGRSAQHTVIDLEPWDHILFQGFGYSTPDDARAHMIEQGADTLFADQGVEAVFLNTSIALVSDQMIDI